MGSKRRASIKREGVRNFAPDCDPCYTYNGKTLTGEYDRACFMEGWAKEQSFYESRLQREAEEARYDQD